VAEHVGIAVDSGLDFASSATIKAAAQEAGLDGSAAASRPAGLERP
jgi:hypothetical protein